MRGTHEFLHDLKNDPDELVNLAKESGARGGFERALRERTTMQRVAEYRWPARSDERPELQRLDRASSQGLGGGFNARPGADGFVKSDQRQPNEWMDGRS